MKTCSKCKIEKDDSSFSRRGKNGLQSVCKDCKKMYNKKYYQNNEENIKQSYQDNKEHKKQYYQDNKKQIQRYKQQHYHKNKIQIKENRKQYRKYNKEKIRETNKKYVQNNREKIRIKQKKWEQKQYDISPNFGLRHVISKSISYSLKINNGSKNGKSCLQYLDYTIEELKIHLENQFSLPENLDMNNNIWMTWNNHGKYISKTWNDNDPTTWKWQLDHIIPHSLFKYTNMDCKEFLACWSLSNLRPLSAKQNVLDGSSKIRHKNI